MSAKCVASMGSGVAGLPINVGTLLDRSLLLRIGRVCHLPIHSAVRTLQTGVRQDDRPSWRRSRLQTLETPSRAPLRPRFQRPSREVKVQRLRVQAAEACSLSFDAVDPFQQEGMTRRMLVFFKSLEDSLSYWEGEEQRKEQAFRLLLVPDVGMAAIRCAVTNASDFIDDRRYRAGYEALCGVRHWLLSPLLDVVVLPEPGSLASPDAQDSAVPETNFGDSVSGVSNYPNSHTLDSNIIDMAGQDVHAHDATDNLIVAAELATPPTSTLPIKNTFIHFNLFPTSPKRHCSVPVSSTPSVWNGDAVETISCDIRGLCRDAMPKSLADVSERCQTSCSPKTSTVCPSAVQWHKDFPHVQLSDERNPRSGLPTHSVVLVEEADFSQKTVTDLSDQPARMPTSFKATSREVKVHNTFIHLDDGDQDSCHTYAPKRCSSSPPSLSHSDYIENVGTNVAQKSQEEKQRSRRHNGRGSKKRYGLKEGEKFEGHSPDLPPEQSPADNCYGFFRYEWVENAEKLNGKLRLLMRRFTLPVGDITLTLCPQGSALVRERGGGPSFKDVLGHAVCEVRCKSKASPKVILALSLGSDSLCPGVQHDFSKKPMFKFPKVLDLWSATDASTGSFKLICTIIARP